MNKARFHYRGFYFKLKRQDGYIFRLTMYEEKPVALGGLKLFTLRRKLDSGIFEAPAWSFDWLRMANKLISDYEFAKARAQENERLMLVQTQRLRAVTEEDIKG